MSITKLEGGTWVRADILIEEVFPSLLPSSYSLLKPSTTFLLSLASHRSTNEI